MSEAIKNGKVKVAIDNMANVTFINSNITLDQREEGHKLETHVTFQGFYYLNPENYSKHGLKLIDFKQTVAFEYNPI